MTLKVYTVPVPADSVQRNWSPRQAEQRSRGYQTVAPHSSQRCTRSWRDRVASQNGALSGVGDGSRRGIVRLLQSVAAVPSTIVEVHDNTPPHPFATAISAPGTWRSTHSPRSWRTASTSTNMPYMPGWV